MRRILGLGWIWMLLPACDALVGNPCQDWVDYACECHAGDPTYDCETIRLAHEVDDVEHYEDCQVALEEAEAADAISGFVCANADTGGASDTGGGK